MVVVQKKKGKIEKHGPFGRNSSVGNRLCTVNASNNSRCSWHRETINYQKTFLQRRNAKIPLPTWSSPRRPSHLGCDANISKCLNGVISKSKSDYTWEHSLNVSRGLPPLENDPNSVTNIACSASNIYFTVPYQDKCRCKRRIYPTRGSGDDLINIFINYTYYGVIFVSRDLPAFRLFDFRFTSMENRSHAFLRSAKSFYDFRK